jgi:hypothetical protein
MALNQHKPEWTLKEISEWTHEDSKVSIPAIQRGLVWKPQQVELLWDSILRQFPIGSFTLSTSSEDGESSYNLLDGQQRWNAISLGYGSVLGDLSSVRSVLWFDLMPEKVWNFNKTTRKYFVRATTKAHPWGYDANDDCGRFNTAQKRDALKQLGMSGKNIYKKDIFLSETYPVKSGLPLPLFWLLEAGEKSNGDRAVFTQIIQGKIIENRTNHFFRLKEEIIPDELIAKYQTVFEDVSKYLVPTIYLEQRIIDKESETDKTVGEETWSDIEILFARIGTGGTQITQNELIYSAIKAYWPRNIKDENDRLAELYMPPFSLISLAFRLALSPNENGSLSSALSVKKVRQIAADKNSESYQSILKLYDKQNDKESELESILRLVDDWLTKDETGIIEIPRVLRTGMARTSPDVYLLLMGIAKMVVEGRIVPTNNDTLLFRALAFYCHWMVDKGARGHAASSIYNVLIKTPHDKWSGIIKMALMELYVQQKAIPLITPEAFCRLFEGKIGADPGWRTWKDDRSNKPWWPLWCLVASNREMLLYAQREYLCGKFPNYDPAKLDLWEEHNRPWDYDHIIPQDWIYQYRAWRKTFSDYCCEWKDNNGNLAAIPFETNRAKSNEADWQEYIDNQKQLLADEEIGKYQDLFHSSLTENKEESHRFAQKTFKRLCKIYAEVYNLLYPVDINADDTIPLIDCGLGQRQKRLRYIAERLGGSVYFECNGKEYPQTRNEDWARTWMSVGFTINGYYPAITMEIDQKCRLVNNIEIGLRRMPNSYELTGNMPSDLLDKCKTYCPKLGIELSNGSWWHIVTNLPIETPDDVIVNHLKALGQFASSELK